MATPHLTRNSAASPASLNALEKDGASHLVVVRQTADWTNREFVVPPCETRYAWAEAWGAEAHRGYTGWWTTSVGTDTQALVNLANTQIAGAGWTSGDKALFSCFARCFAPKILHTSSSPYVSDYRRFSACLQSSLAYCFNLRHLPFYVPSQSASRTFSAYARVWQPSYLQSADPAVDYGTPMNQGILPGGPMLNSCSKLKMRLVSDEDIEGGDVAPGDVEAAACDTYELHDWCDNGERNGWPQNLKIVNGCWPYYPRNPANGAYQTRGGQSDYGLMETALMPTRIYVPTKGYSPTGQDVSGRAVDGNGRQLWYRDIQLTAAASLALLRTNPGKVWLVARFHPGNGFGGGYESSSVVGGCGVGVSTTMYAKRIELVIRVTGGRFNT